MSESGSHRPLRVEQERVSQGLRAPVWVRNEHLARYLFAAAEAAGKDVVDCACGDGTCASLLAEHAASVLGFDKEQEVIDVACRKEIPRARFAVADAAALPIENAAADLYVSLETIEHLPDPAAFLHEVTRVLRENGTFICSTPDRDVYDPGVRLGTAPWNRFHVHEFTQSEFRELLGRFFEEITLYGQNQKSPAFTRARAMLARHSPGRLIVRLTQLTKVPRVFWDSVERHSVVLANPCRRYEYLVAVCSRPRGDASSARVRQ